MTGEASRTTRTAMPWTSDGATGEASCFGQYFVDMTLIRLARDFALDSLTHE